MTKRTFTYQTRLNLPEETSNFLLDFAKVINQAERRLYSDFSKGEIMNAKKSLYIKKYGITARHFNAIKIYLQGKISSIIALREDYIDDLKARIKKTKSSIKALSTKREKTIKSKQALHQKNLLLVRQENKLNQFKQDKKDNKVRLCFGSKKLFNKQFFLEENNYSSHKEWLLDWQNSRSNQFNLIGSKDETSGNQSCIATLNEDNSIALRIKVPLCLQEKYGNFINIPKTSFKYGHDVILEAIHDNIKRNKCHKKQQRTLHGDLYKQYGQAINYKFLLDNKGWRVFVTTEKQSPKKISTQENGVIGIDINEAHLAITEINRTGNPINSFNVPLNIYGKSSDQTKAIIGNACKQIVDYACLTNKALVVEQLDFQQKKKDLKSKNAKRARMLSSFAYQSIHRMLTSRAFRNGIDVFSVNPAYTSIIGRVKFAKLHKLSVHKAAALVIGRRHQKFSERLPRSLDKISDNKGSYVSLPVLAKIQGKHVWSSWAIILKNFKAALAVQYQMFRSACNNKLVLTGGNGDLEEPLDTIPF